MPEDRPDPGERGAEGAPAEPPTPAAFRVMEVRSVTVELPEQYPLLALQEAEGAQRPLTFPIGMAEGVALAYALRRIRTPRPLTHELFVSTLRQLNVDVVAVRLTGRQGGTYEAELDLIGPQGRRVLSCRPTDGVALALRQSIQAPILADERLLAGPGDVEPVPTVVP